jgi:hypothetical protein
VFLRVAEATMPPPQGTEGYHQEALDARADSDDLTWMLAMQDEIPRLPAHEVRSHYSVRGTGATHRTGRALRILLSDQAVGPSTAAGFAEGAPNVLRYAIVGSARRGSGINQALAIAPASQDGLWYKANILLDGRNDSGLSTLLVYYVP